jgi:hypothetical protein
MTLIQIPERERWRRRFVRSTYVFFDCLFLRPFSLLLAWSPPPPPPSPRLLVSAPVLGISVFSPYISPSLQIVDDKLVRDETGYMLDGGRRLWAERIKSTEKGDGANGPSRLAVRGREGTHYTSAYAARHLIMVIYPVTHIPSPPGFI